MKGKVLCLLLLIFYVFPSSVGAVSAQQDQETIVRVAQLEVVTGNVHVKRGGGLKDFSAYEGMSLLEGDFVQTDADSSVTIVFEESRTTLGAHTQVYITKLKNEEGTNETVLSQWSGQTWHNVMNLLNANDTHDVESATSIMGVRGTLFTIVIDPGSGIERLVVLEGVVENKLMREEHSGQPGQDVSVAEQLDIRLETKERIERGIDYDELVEEIDLRIIAVIYEDVLNRADDFFTDNDGVNFEDRNRQMERILVALEADLMLELIDQLTQAIERTDEEKREQIDAQLRLNMQKDLNELEQEILEKRLRQIEQYEQLREQARENGVTDDELETFIEQNGGERILERILQLPDIKKELEERLQQPELSIESRVNTDQRINELSSDLVNLSVDE